MRLMTWQTLSISPYRHRHHRFPDGMPLQHAQTARRRRRPPRHARPRASPGVTRAWPGASRAALEVASVHPAAAAVEGAGVAVGAGAGSLGGGAAVPVHRYTGVGPAERRNPAAAGPGGAPTSAPPGAPAAPAGAPPGPGGKLPKGGAWQI
jgi:hypothetical protein